MIEIKDRWTNAVIYRSENAESVKAALEEAVRSHATLYGANLYGANLYGANLSHATLYGANLSHANLYGANLSHATLYGANLYGANLYGANLSHANLDGANLHGADLYGANLYGANLDGGVSMTGLRWPVLVFFRQGMAALMQVGCQRHAVEEWAAFDDAAISKMDNDALTFWREWREPLLALAKHTTKEN